MLTEPDLQARYLAATLGVIESEIQKLDLKTDNRRVLAALIAGATRAATRLASELERSTAASGSVKVAPPVEHCPDNVIAFATVRNGKR
jgi:predicted regulator of Ras-like GTPase activity (Roadblock/LC7/MglB family)